MGIYGFLIGSHPIAKVPINYGKWALILEPANAVITFNLSDVFLSKSRSLSNLFITISSNGYTWHFSNEMLDGGQYLWDQKIVRLPSIRFQAKDKGGYVTLNWGQIVFLDDSFINESGNQIATPDEVIIKAEWGANDTLGRLKTIFEGEAYFRTRDETTLTFDLFEKEFKINALEEGLSSSESTTFLITGMVSLGGGLVEIQTGLTHNFEINDEVVLQGVDSAQAASFLYAGKYKITAVDIPNKKFTILIAGFSDYTTNTAECSKDIIPIPLAIGTLEHILPVRTGFGDAQFEYKYYRPNFINVVGSGLDIFDDSVDINSNFAGDAVANRYLQTSTAVIGKFSAGDTASMATLFDLFNWACDASRLNLTFKNIHNAENISINFIQKEQILLIGLLDKVASYCNYQFYIQDNDLFLLNNSIGHGDLGELENSEIFKINFKKEMPTKSYIAKWQTHAPSKMRGDGITSIPILADLNNELLIAGSSPLGDERIYKVYDQQKLDIKSKIELLKNEREKKIIEVEIPLENLPTIGGFFIYIDGTKNPAVTYSVIIHDLNLNFENSSILIKGRAVTL